MKYQQDIPIKNYLKVEKMSGVHIIVAILKKEVSDIKVIFSRLDVAIEKITDVSTCVNRMLAVHEEKIANARRSSARANKNLQQT